jgi:hypothetical protein
VTGGIAKLTVEPEGWRLSKTTQIWLKMFGIAIDSGDAAERATEARPAGPDSEEMQVTPPRERN